MSLKTIIIICLAIALLYCVYTITQLKKAAQGAGVLMMGSKGADVLRLQQKLNDVINKAATGPVLSSGNQAFAIDVINEDGIFSHPTQIALIAITGKSTIAISEIDNISVN